MNTGFMIMQPQLIKDAINWRKSVLPRIQNSVFQLVSSAKLKILYSNMK